MEPTTTEIRPEPTRPVLADQRPVQPEPDFFALPAAPTAVFLASAVTLAMGAWLLVASAMGDEARHGDRLGLVVTLLAYVLAVGGAAIVLCRWHWANPDAAAPTVLVAVVAAGAGLALSTCVVQAGSGVRVGLGLLTALTTVGMGWWLIRAVLVPPGWPVGAAWVALALWNGLGPVWLGADHQGWRAGDGAAWWVVGQGVLLVAGLAIIGVAMGGPRWRGPLLARPAFAVCVGLVLLGGSGVHLLVQAWILDAPLRVGDAWGLIALVTCGAMAVRWTGRGEWDEYNSSLVVALLLFGLCCSGEVAWGMGNGQSGNGTGWWWTWASLLRPAVGMIVLGGWLAWVGWRSGARAAQILAIAALAEGVLVWNLGIIPPRQAFAATLPMAAILGGLGLVALAWRRDQPGLALVGLALVVSPVAVLTMARAVQVQVALVDLWAVVVLAGVLVWPRRIDARVAAVAGGALLLVAGWVWREAQPWTVGERVMVQVACAVPVLMVVLAAWRQRSWMTALPLVLVLGGVLVQVVLGCASWLWMWRPRNPGWVLVTVAFALLAGGLLAGRRRLAATAAGNVDAKSPSSLL